MAGQDLVLDSAVRDWVLLPLTLSVLLMMVLRQYMTKVPAARPIQPLNPRPARTLARDRYPPLGTERWQLCQFEKHGKLCMSRVTEAAASDGGGAAGGALGPPSTESPSSCRRGRPFIHLMYWHVRSLAPPQGSRYI